MLYCPAAVILDMYNRSVLVDVGITSNSSITLLSDLYAEHLEVLREHLHGTGNRADSTVVYVYLASH